MTHSMMILAGPASTQLGGRVAELLQLPQVAYDARRFPDGETQVELGDDVRDHHVCLIQSTSPPLMTSVMFSTFARS